MVTKTMQTQETRLSKDHLSKMKMVATVMQRVVLLSMLTFRRQANRQKWPSFKNWSEPKVKSSKCNHKCMNELSMTKAEEVNRPQLQEKPITVEQKKASI